MSIISKPNTFSPNTTASSSQVNANFDTLYNDYNGGISAANLAASAVTTAKIADDAVTADKIPDNSITAAKVAAGFPVQFVDAYLNSSDGFSAVIPQDDTIPQNDEGQEILTVSITPKSATNTLKVRAKVYFSYGTAEEVTVALFRDSTADAIGAAGAKDSSSGAMACIPAEASVVAGSTSSTTFKLRLGSTSGSIRYNGSGNRFFGDIPKTYMEVIEVKAS